jgi:hypothetical protein
MFFWRVWWLEWKMELLRNKVVSSFLWRLLVLMLRCGIRRLLEVLLVKLSWRNLVIVANSDEAFFNKKFAWCHVLSRSSDVGWLPLDGLGGEARRWPGVFLSEAGAELESKMRGGKNLVIEEKSFAKWRQTTI